MSSLKVKCCTVRYIYHNIYNPLQTFLRRFCTILSTSQDYIAYISAYISLKINKFLCAVIYTFSLYSRLYVIKGWYYHIRDLRRIRRHLSKSVAITLSNALVGSKIDYCNSLFYGVTDQQMQRLQRILNTLCRIVTCTHRFSSITGPLSSLHWLPVRYRIQFKIY